MQQVKRESEGYKIKYIECNEKNHEGEKLNLVCLQSECAEKSLICSLCKEGKHKNHHTTPLKFYIEQLKKQYGSSLFDYEKQLQELQKTRISFLMKMQSVVEKLSQEIRNLQQDAMDRFEFLRSQILEKQSRKKQFHDFYLELKSEPEKEPQFFMSQYLPKKQIGKVINLDFFQKFKENSVLELALLKKKLFSDSQGDSNPFNLIQLKQYIKPQNIKVNGDIFTQSLNANNTYPSLVLLNMPFNKCNQKVKIKIVTFKKGGKLTFGFIQKQFFQSKMFVWGGEKSDNVMWFSSDGGSHATKVATLKNIVEGCKIELQRENETFIFSNRKNQVTFIPKNNDKDYYFFFALQGNVSVQIVCSSK